MSDGGVEPEGPEDDDTTGPPVMLLLVAALCVVAGLVLLASSSFGAHVVGYVVASLVTIVLVGVYRRVDLIRRLSAGYRPVPQIRRGVPILLVLAFVVAGLHVWAIATEVAS